MVGQCQFTCTQSAQNFNLWAKAPTQKRAIYFGKDAFTIILSLKNANLSIIEIEERKTLSYILMIERLAFFKHKIIVKASFPKEMALFWVGGAFLLELAVWIILFAC
jgi:hypothetical protein